MVQVRGAASLRVMAYKVTLKTPSGDQVIECAGELSPAPPLRWARERRERREEGERECEARKEHSQERRRSEERGERKKKKN